MSKLKLNSIKKNYILGDTKVEALKGISIEFRDNEFVSILGPSGCGKTTLLNVIGGLDRYDSGDLIINNISTKNYIDSDWDFYRNKSIGFVFQNYNLITHQTVLQNVEIAMTLSGVSKAERRKRAKQALKDVGLADQISKKPNQLSGGQMQRVAIARALVNNPDIILADEPTGALDTNTSIQVMKILKNISKTKLVIMVTHNGEMANRYSNRIINLLDGEITNDSNPIEEKDESSVTIKPNLSKNKTSMSFFTALSLSFKNLLTKKWRTLITAIAGSIGIIGVALVLALSSGLSNYINQMQGEALSGFPITISTTNQSINRNEMNSILGSDDDEYKKFTSENIIYNYNSEENTTVHKNILTDDFLEYIENIENELPDAVSTISYTRGIDMNILAKGDSSITKFNTTKTVTGDMGEEMFGNNNLFFQELPDNEEFILSLYDLIGEGSRLPKEKNEIAIVIDEYNRIDTAFFEKLGITINQETFKLTDFIGKELLKVIPNNDFYTKTKQGLFIPANISDYATLYDSNTGITLTVTGILRIKEDATTSYLSTGIVYSKELTDYIVKDAENSEIAISQSEADYDVLLGTPFVNEDVKTSRLQSLGVITRPTGINIYPKDFDSKDQIKEYLNDYNKGKTEEDQIVYTDLAEMVTSMIGTMINTITLVLVAFAAISLVVSTIMIAIIIYVSVIERTKEIGILRSVGARKKDISRMFIAEAVIIGFIAGSLGIILSYLLTIPINSIVNNLVGISGIANLTIFSASILILGSILLTSISGFFPSRIAAKKDPVTALRTE